MLQIRKGSVLSKQEQNSDHAYESFVCVPLDGSISLHSLSTVLLVKSLDTLKACSRALENHYQLSVNMHYAASICVVQSVTIDCH